MDLDIIKDKDIIINSMIVIDSSAYSNIWDSLNWNFSFNFKQNLELKIEFPFADYHPIQILFFL